MPNVWGKGGIHEGKYHRHSVENDVRFFAGWKILKELYQKIEQPTYSLVAIFAFKLAARITEALNTEAEMFVIDQEGGFIFVRNFPILKRWKAIDKVVFCQRCGTRNNKFDMACSKCGANLVHSGKRKFITERQTVYRIPFYIKLAEPFSDEMVKFLKDKKGLLFPSPYTGKAYTRNWAYNIIKDYGKIVGLDNLYNHWFRSQRLMQLANEYKFNREELKVFSGIIKDETLDHYVKQIQPYTEKLGIKMDSERFTELMERKR